MIIGQLVIEFELRGPEPFGRICIPQTDYFHGKAKISKANTRVIIYCKK